MKQLRITALIAVLLLTGICVSQAQQKKPVHHTVQSLAAAMARGKAVYTQVCLPCHMADGGGVQNMNPPLINTTYVLGNKTALIKIVLHGFNADVEINGQTYSNTMSAHDDLTDRQIADVLTYVRHSFGNKASVVKTAEVSAARAASKK